MSADLKVERLSKFLKSMLDYADGDFDVIFTLKKNGAIHDFAMVARPALKKKGSEWKGRPPAAKTPPKT